MSTVSMKINGRYYYYIPVDLVCDAIIDVTDVCSYELNRICKEYGHLSYIEQFQQVLDAHDIDRTIQSIVVESPRFNGYLLCNMLKRNSTDVMSFMTENQGVIDYTSRNRDGETPLTIAAACPYDTAEIIQTMIDEGADMNVRNEAGFTPLMIAILMNRKINIDVIIGACRDTIFEVSPCRPYNIMTPSGAVKLRPSMNIAEIASAAKQPVLYNRLKNFFNKPTKSAANTR